MTWAAIPAGPGGALSAALAVRDGPPRSYQLDGAVYELRPSWWPLLELLPGGAWRLPLVLDMTHPDDAAVLRTRLHDRTDPLRARDVEAIGTALVEHATARPWWVAERLFAFVLEHFAELDGRLPGGVADLVEHAPARLCNTVHMALVEGAEKKEREKFDAELYRPPARSLEARTPPKWLAEDEGAGFMAVMAQAGGAGALPRGGKR